MQEYKDPVNHPVNDPLHARSDPMLVQMVDPKEWILKESTKTSQSLFHSSSSV